jgi:phage gp36-like protein
LATFATNADVEKRIEGGTATLAMLTGSDPYDTSVVDRARDGAAGKIRAKVGVKFVIPADLSPYAGVAEFLRELELDLVEGELWGRVRETVPERVKEKVKATMSLLDAIAKGEAVLPTAAELPSATAGAGTATVTGSERVFTRDAMDGMF